MSEGSHLTSEIRWRAVDAVLEGMTKTAVAAAYGVERNTISRWVNKFEEGGDEALHRRVGSGRPQKLLGFNRGTDLSIPSMSKLRSTHSS